MPRIRLMTADGSHPAARCPDRPVPLSLSAQHGDRTLGCHETRWHASSRSDRRAVPDDAGAARRQHRDGLQRLGQLGARECVRTTGFLIKQAMFAVVGPGRRCSSRCGSTTALPRSPPWCSGCSGVTLLALVAVLLVGPGDQRHPPLVLPWPASASSRRSSPSSRSILFTAARARAPAWSASTSRSTPSARSSSSSCRCWPSSCSSRTSAASVALLAIVGRDGVRGRPALAIPGKRGARGALPVVAAVAMLAPYRRAAG